MAIELNIPDKVQIRLTSYVELMRTSLERYLPWIEQTMGVPLSETLTLEVDCNPADAVAEELLQGLPVVSATKVRNRSWQTLIEGWVLPSSVSPRITATLQRERKPKAAPFPVWELEWQDCPVALKLRGLQRPVVSVKVPLVFPPGDVRILPHWSARHWFIAHREDAAKVLRLKQQVQDRTERYLETAYGPTRLQARYDWETVVLDSTARRMVRSDFELFFVREDWFRQHNLPYRRGYLLWGPPGNGKSATIRVMAAHPHIRPYTLDLSDMEEKSANVHQLFEKAAENTPALVILEDLDRAFPNEGKRTRERTVSFQTLLNCLDGVGTQDGIIVVATANDPTCLDPAILKRPGRFDRVVQFRNPDATLRRQYYGRLNPILAGEQLEAAIDKTEGFSFAQLRETYILGAQSAFEHGREIRVADVIEAIELQSAGAYDLKTSIAASGFVCHAEGSARR
jgi:ATPase family associated with various cellular activities (AAA)